MPHKDPEARAAYHKAYREKHAERLREQAVEWRNANADRLAESKRLDYLLNVDAYKARAKASRERNAGKIRAHRSTQAYRDAKNARRRALYLMTHPPQPKKTPKSRDELLKDKQRDYHRNKERYKAVMRSYYSANKDKWDGAWQKKTLAQRKFEHSVKKARTKGAEIVDLDSLREYYRQVFGNESAVCSYCRGSFEISKITIDHKQPYKLGGKHEVSNLAVSCLLCNLKKGTKPFEQWQALLA